MSKNNCCDSENRDDCCSIESILTMDERGQMVLPKDLREKANIKPGDKLALISFGDEENEICCFALIKAEKLAGSVQGVLKPLLSITK